MPNLTLYVSPAEAAKFDVGTENVISLPVVDSRKKEEKSTTSIASRKPLEKRQVQKDTGNNDEKLQATTKQEKPVANMVGSKLTPKTVLRKKEVSLADLLESPVGTRTRGSLYDDHEKKIILEAVAKSSTKVKLGGLTFWKELCAQAS